MSVKGAMITNTRTHRSAAMDYVPDDIVSALSTLMYTCTACLACGVKLVQHMCSPPLVAKHMLTLYGVDRTELALLLLLLLLQSHQYSHCYHLLLLHLSHYNTHTHTLYSHRSERSTTLMRCPCTERSTQLSASWQSRLAKTLSAANVQKHHSQGLV